MKGLLMTMTETRQDARSALYLQLSETRDETVRATLTKKASISAVLKGLQSVRETETHRRGEILAMTETLTGEMFLSPSGTSVYVLKPTTRVVDGVKKSMLSVKHNIPVSDVLTFEVKR